jgi:hypothetical protein
MATLAAVPRVAPAALWWRLAVAALAVFLLVRSAPVLAQATEPLTVVTSTGRHVFQVEVMRTPEQRARGLMFRQHLPRDRGMLFDFESVQPVSMWMQNTYIPLDMVFIRADGTVARVAERTEPLSTRTIPSGEPVLGVLEVNGGIAAEIGLKAGDRIEHPLFARR